MTAKVTRRGKVVFTLLFIAVIWFLNNITTPAECKVAFDQMPGWCKELLYP